MNVEYFNLLALVKSNENTVINIINKSSKAVTD